ncbi:MAG: hypothetical protein IPK15_01535 [Verrucomicrobia bacterium]|nr:hypothetical protein [Verrucomicrobiota bacterium]
MNRFPIAVVRTLLAVGGWISKAGGQIRHPEFRNEAPPTGQQKEQSDHTHP